MCREQQAPASLMAGAKGMHSPGECLQEYTLQPMPYAGTGIPHRAPTDGVGFTPQELCTVQATLQGPGLESREKQVRGQVSYDGVHAGAAAGWKGGQSPCRRHCTCRGSRLCAPSHAL